MCLGFTVQIKENASFSKEIQAMTGFKKEIIGLFLATTSSEDFQSYRLYNAVLYLQRNGVDLSTVFLKTQICLVKNEMIRGTERKQQVKNSSIYINYK